MHVELAFTDDTYGLGLFYDSTKGDLALAFLNFVVIVSFPWGDKSDG